MTKFTEKESFKHKLAKDLLFDWLTDFDENDDFRSVYPIQWRKNYGVFKELKFYDSSDPYYFELSRGLKHFEYKEGQTEDPRGKNCIDWFDPLYDRGKILFVPDITIFHKGTASILIEVAHTHYLTDKKINDIAKFFSGTWCEIYEIKAEDILRLTCKPDKLPIHNLIKL